jgi:hypothetical protein
MSIYPYRTQQLRDLAWACFSPPLLHTQQLAKVEESVSNCALALTPGRCTWLESLDRDPTRLLQHLAQRPTGRLGLYFEQLWHFFLDEDPAVELLTHNLPVRHQGKTLGEFDIIYHCKQRQKNIHLELAVKYFLGYEQPGQGDPNTPRQAWIGPNARDRLDLKVDHLLLRQIKLGLTAPAIELLGDLGISDLQQEVEVKGYLFNSLANPLPAPHGFNEDCQMQQWLPVTALGDYLQQSSASTYRVLPRALWLSPAMGQVTEEHVTASELLLHLEQHFGAHNRPQLIAALDSKGQENRRFFVTGAQWPQQAE